MEKYKIEFTKEQICLLQVFLESVYNRFCWSYHIAKMSKHQIMCASNLTTLNEISVLMDEIHSQIMIQDGNSCL